MNPIHPSSKKNNDYPQGGVVVGEFVADMLVEDSILIEIKALKQLNDNHMAQCLNYLKATGLDVCLLINFGSARVEVKRVMKRA